MKKILTDNLYFLSDEKEYLQLECIHKWLSEKSYWAKGIPESIVKNSIQNSLCFGVYKLSGEQVGFARVVSDYSTFAYLADVFILENHRGKKLSLELMQFIMQHPLLQNLRRFCLGTHDAHSLYEKYGFKVIEKPQNFMEIKIENIYHNS